ncbi:MAG: HEAT repeat domain-containing protein [Nanoarchaeota archaeon]|nr:HEAT repeat domain-containing protein [Nanoarchaeota archaeon]
MAIEDILRLPQLEQLEDEIENLSSLSRYYWKRRRYSRHEEKLNGLWEQAKPLREERKKYTPLLRRLKSRTSETRISAIRKLGEINTERAVQALIYIADGNPRDFVPGIWRTLWKQKIRSMYELGDQLEATGVLSKMNVAAADDYILGLFICELKPLGSSPIGCFGGNAEEMPDDKATFEEYGLVFPNLKGELGFYINARVSTQYPPGLKLGNQVVCEDHLPNNDIGNTLKNAYCRVMERRKG